MNGQVGWLALLFGAALLPAGRELRRCAAGLVALGLGLAAWEAGPPPAGALPSDFVAIDAGLMLFGLGCAGWAGVAAARAGRRGYPAAIAIGAGAAALAPPITRFAAEAPLPVTGAALLAFTAAGVVLALATSRLRRWLTRSPTPPEPLPSEAAGPWAVVLGGGVVATGLGPHLALVFLGALAAGVAGWRIGRSGEIRGRPVVPILMAAALTPAYWLFATVAGEQGLALSTLSDLPLSPAAESLLAPPVLLAAGCLSGLWPIPRRIPAGLTAPAGLLLAGRVALAALPGGMEQWRPLVFPLLLLGLWQAAAAARWTALAGGAALLGIVSGAPEGVAGAWWLGGAAVILEGSARLAGRGVATARGAAVVLAGWGALLVMEGGLRAEVVYTAFTAAGVALAAAPGRPQPMIARVRKNAAARV